MPSSERIGRFLIKPEHRAQMILKRKARYTGRAQKVGYSLAEIKHAINKRERAQTRQSLNHAVRNGLVHEMGYGLPLTVLVSDPVSTYGAKGGRDNLSSLKNDAITWESVRETLKYHHNSAKKRRKRNRKTKASLRKRTVLQVAFKHDPYQDQDFDWLACMHL